MDNDNADEQAQRQAPSYSVVWSCGPQPMWILGSCFCIIGSIPHQIILQICAAQRGIVKSRVFELILEVTAVMTAILID